MSLDSTQNVAVIGLGTMGHGIAQTFAVAGFNVRCFDESTDARDSLLERVRSNLLQMQDAGVGSADSTQAALGRLSVFDDEREAVNNVQFVTEAVPEDLAVKQQLFSRLDAVAPEDAIIASNSSSFPMTQTAVEMEHPERAVVTHWFNPPHIVPLVEVVPGERTSSETTKTTVQVLEQIGKLAIPLKKEVPGFLINRLQTAFFRELWDLLEQGVASAEDIDRAVSGSIGLRLAALGPFAILDFGGMEITARAYASMVPYMRADSEVPDVVRKMVEAGHYGTKTGKGFYEYTPESIEEAQAERDRRYLALAKLLHGN